MGKLGRRPTASVVPVPSRNTVQHGTKRGLTSGFGMSPGVSPASVAVGKKSFGMLYLNILLGVFAATTFVPLNNI